MAINLALIFVLLGIGVMRSGPPIRPNGTLVVDLLREESSGASPSPKPAHVRLTEPKPKVEPPRIILPVKNKVPEEHPLDMIEMSKADMDAADIGKLGTKGSGTAMAAKSDDSEEVGRGPHGEVLYAAEWAREPTDAELGGYLPRNAPEGYGLIACKTLPQNRVDDCVELANYPPGSHLASAVRQAAWQFRVRPPRKNGRELIGEWVRIRIDYTHTHTE